MAPQILGVACTSTGIATAAGKPSSEHDGRGEQPTAATEIRRAWDDYLSSKGGDYARCWLPSEHWRAAEHEAWGCYDLAHSLVPVGMEPTTVQLDWLDSGEYRVRTEFTWRDPSDRWPTVGDRVTTTTYAVREGGRWVFSNALLRATSDWQRETVEPITYVVEPGIVFDHHRAQRAVVFADSVAALFDVPRLGPTTYYVTSSLDSAHEAVGVEFDVTFGPTGGFSRPVNFQVFSGIPSPGEDYRHELVHLLLAPLHTSTTSVWASEGVATWLGGTSGLSYEDAVARLRRFLEANPDATLDAILSSQAHAAKERYPAAALLAEMAFGHGGVEAVRKFYASGPDLEGLRSGMELLLDRPWSEISAEWRKRIAPEQGPGSHRTVTSDNRSTGGSGPWRGLLATRLAPASPVAETLAAIVPQRIQVLKALVGVTRRPGRCGHSSTT